MMQAIIAWTRRLLGIDPVGVAPHPDLDSDQGERRMEQARMEAESLHAGRWSEGGSEPPEPSGDDEKRAGE